MLARLVGELEEPFRETILLRYAEGLEPTQIARRLGIPASTVRWRIKEGLERLRRGLDDAHGGDRKLWLLALAPIALWPRETRAAPAVPVALTILAVGAVAGIALLVAGVRSQSSTPSQTANSRGSGASMAERQSLRTEASWFVQP
ncbi:MAG: helix-turn-helix domain-containing protein, partial [Deltaproteobacteria bacterium]|nr:helix-turn-helix domain-containing protein [Deltaproteobacteria bacterium]